MEEEKKENEPSHKKNNFTEKVRKNPWILSTLICGVLIVGLLASSVFGGFTGNVSKEKAADNLMSYLNNVVDSPVTLVNVQDESGVYLATISYQDQDIPIYLTKDGAYYTTTLVPLATTDTSDSTNTNTQQEIPKSDKPTVELFVMSFCPYGTQAEKGLIPVAELLGDKINFRIRYVYYAMHGEKEVTENLREYCIQETQQEKFLDYVKCFLEGDGVESNGYITNGNDPNKCLAQAGIDTASLNTCIANTDKQYSVTKNLEDESTWLSGTYPLFDVEKALNEQYGVGGSPTLVINGVQSSSGRDSASYLDAICSSFTDDNVPEECATSLSSTSPSVYFGWDSTGSSTTASCS